MRRVIIAGGRDFQDYEYLKEVVDDILNNYDKPEVIIVSGKAKGADTLGEQYADDRGYKKEFYPANWKDFTEPCTIKTNRYGKKYNALAGFHRNELMAKNSDILIAFWDGKSKGTKDMISIADRFGLDVYEVRYVKGSTNIKKDKGRNT